MNSLHKNINQVGSTMTGFILGLVIGLSIAVVVALVINKASTPFTNNNGSVEKSAPTALQMQDPNQPLYGTKAVIPLAPKEIDKPTPTTNVVTDADIPLTPKPLATTEEKNIYFVQVGAFSVQNEAESTRARLALLGVEASITEKTGEGATMYRVRIGPFDNADTMNKMKSKLSDNGVDSVVIKTTK